MICFTSAFGASACGSGAGTASSFTAIAFAPSGKERTATVAAAALGYDGPVFAYNYFGGQGVPNGKQRVASLRDTGTLTARILFVHGEERLRLGGFALARPRLHARRGVIENLAYDP
jgi:hypothetical protein